MKKKLKRNVKQITIPNIWMDVEDGHLNIIDALPNDELKYSVMIEGDSIDFQLGNSGLKLAGLIVKNDERVIMVKEGHNVILKGYKHT